MKLYIIFAQCSMRHFKTCIDNSCNNALSLADNLRGIDRRINSKPKILILLICPCLRLELYNVLTAECIFMPLHWQTI